MYASFASIEQQPRDWGRLVVTLPGGPGKCCAPAAPHRL